MNRVFFVIYLGVMTAMAPLSTDMYLPALPEFQAGSGDFHIHDADDAYHDHDRYGARTDFWRTRK